MRRSKRTSHGIVTLPTLDVRARAAHASELCSQLLMGEVVQLMGGDRSGGWLTVENEADGSVVPRRRLEIRYGYCSVQDRALEPLKSWCVRGVSLPPVPASEPDGSKLLSIPGTIPADQ